jgi:hypothetical protein
MDIEHILKESELENHIPLMGLTLQSGKDEFLHNLLTKYSSNPTILRNRAEQICQLRKQNPIDYTDCIEYEKILKEYETPPADIYAVYADRLEHSPRVAHFLEHLKDYLKDYINSQM